MEEHTIDKASENSGSQPLAAEVSKTNGGFLAALEEEVSLAGGPWTEDETTAGAVGRTMYDTPYSKDGTVTVLLPPDQIQRVPSGSLLRIKSRKEKDGGDGRQYLGAVVEGPFAEPDGLKADAPIVVTTQVRGASFTPRYHGRVQVEIMHEEVGGTTRPPRFRPLPNSPAFALDEDETGQLLRLGGEIQLGYVVGFESLRAGIPATKKSVLPRHSGVLGTTGGGKSTTVSNMVRQFQEAGFATVLIDTEGEYTHIDKPTEDAVMQSLLDQQDRQPEGVSKVGVCHLVNRETTAEGGTPVKAFSLEFASLSPYAVAEILDFTGAQEGRFFKAYDLAKLVLRDLKIFPRDKNQEDEKLALALNEFETGYPGLTISILIDILDFILDSFQAPSAVSSKKSSKKSQSEDDSVGEETAAEVLSTFNPYNDVFKPSKARTQINKRIASIELERNEVSWRALRSKLWRLQRMNIFDQKVGAIPYEKLIVPGKVSILDLSDTDSTVVNNLVIANVLRGLQLAQEDLYQKAEKENRQPTPLMVIIEEAHEFLSRERISKMKNVFEQVARIARRGRKRWMGLIFVTQLPQHLPDEVLGLINNFILHKISDVNVIGRLKQSIGGVDDGLWRKLSSLAPGQAIVSVTSYARPVLVAIDPTACKLRMID
jgi:Helicase HerA, central domain